MSDSMKNCPFCGSAAQIEPWHGGGPLKRLVGCQNDDCEVMPSITGSTPQRAIAKWNRREPVPSPGAPTERERRLAGDYVALVEKLEHSDLGGHALAKLLLGTSEPMHEAQSILASPATESEPRAWVGVGPVYSKAPDHWWYVWIGPGGFPFDRECKEAEARRFAAEIASALGLPVREGA